MKLWRILLMAVASLFLVWAGTPVSAVRAQDQEDEGAPVCPLSKDQTQKAIEAFAALAPVFRVDRCINCHGDVDPFMEDDGGHEPGPIPQIRDAQGAVDFGQTFAQCTSDVPPVSAHGIIRQFA